MVIREQNEYWCNKNIYSQSNIEMEKKHIVNHIVNKTDGIIDMIKKPVFMTSILALHIVYFLIFIGIVSVNSKYLDLLNIFIQVFIAAILIYRFNPLRTAELKSFDQEIIFGSAMILLTNVGVTHIFSLWGQAAVGEPSVTLRPLS